MISNSAINANIEQMLKNFEEQVKEEIDLEKLSPRNIARADELQKAGKVLPPKTKQLMDGMEDHFTCTICQKIVLEPKECTKCQTPFCGKCIETWKQQSQSCPLRCDRTTYSDMHRLVKASMLAVRFFCPMVGCEYHRDYKKEGEDPEQPVPFDQVGLPYQEALNHLKKCNFLAHYCEKGCGAKLYSYEVAEHEKVCPNYEEYCDKCEQFFRPNLPGGESLASHDCIEVLKRRYQEKKKEEARLNMQLGINYDRVNVCCPRGHQLEVQRGWICQLIQNNRGGDLICSGCGRTELNQYDMYYSYKQNNFECKHHLCRACALQTCQPPILEDAGLKLQIHSCPLTPHALNSQVRGAWKCDMANEEGGCESGCIRFNSTQYVYGLECRRCNFDICLKCALKKLSLEEELACLKES